MSQLQVLLIDNFDSFAFNLVDELRRQGAAVDVWRNDIAAEEALALDGEHPTALATMTILELRLATLPWIAALFAGDAPDGTVEGSIAWGRRAVARGRRPREFPSR